jgi:hypothetical protein
MAGPNGTLRTGKVSESGDVEFDEASAFEARIEAHKRLSGALFGPTPVKTFQWTFDSLLQHVDDKNLLQQLLSVPSFRSKFDEFMKQELDARFDGDRDRLTQASENEQLDLWLRMWDAIGLDAPPRQTCLIVTINDLAAEF